jgi:hypothetical protein
MDQNDYEITPEKIEENIVQEIYSKMGYRTSICMLMLSTGAEVLGTHAPVSTEKFDLLEGKKAARENAIVKAKAQLEAIATWRQTVDEMHKAKAEQEAQENYSGVPDTEH